MMKCYIALYDIKKRLYFEPVWAEDDATARELLYKNKDKSIINSVNILTENEIFRGDCRLSSEEKSKYVAEYKQVLLAGIAYEKAKQAMEVAKKQLELQQSLMYDTGGYNFVQAK